jgi:hypothetical protein
MVFTPTLPLYSIVFNECKALQGVATPAIIATFKWLHPIIKLSNSAFGSSGPQMSTA